jgi:hypothetical protein
MHQFVEVTENGTSYIYDNMHPDGMLKSEYMQEIAGYVQGKHISGAQLMDEGGQYLKEVAQ